MYSVVKSLICGLLIVVPFAFEAELVWDAVDSNHEVCISPEEHLLYELLMEYRAEFDLPIIPISSELTMVAQEHCKDLVVNSPDLVEGCSVHSWSYESGFKGCCHGLDGSNPDCIWDKPYELTGYPGPGYEIVVGTSKNDLGRRKLSLGAALEAWANSPSHNCVILNLEPFNQVEWRSIGIAVNNGFACVWFGEKESKWPMPKQCY